MNMTGKLEIDEVPAVPGDCGAVFEENGIEIARETGHEEPFFFRCRTSTAVDGGIIHTYGRDNITGITSRPVLLGEAGVEAVVPLGGSGRSIPVQFQNGSPNGAGDIYVVANVREAIAHGFKNTRDTMLDLVSNDIRKGVRVVKSLRRGVRG